MESGDVEAAWKKLDVGRKRIILDQVVTVTIMPSVRGAKGFDASLLQFEWADDD